MMEVLPQELINFFGISGETLAMLSLVMFVLVEGIKKQLPNVFVGGGKTQVLTAVVAVVVTLSYSFKTVTAWTPEVAFTTISTAILLWIAPQGLHALVKKFQTNGG